MNSFVRRLENITQTTALTFRPPVSGLAVFPEFEVKGRAHIRHSDPTVAHCFILPQRSARHLPPGQDYCNLAADLLPSVRVLSLVTLLYTPERLQVRTSLL